MPRIADIRGLHSVKTGAPRGLREDRPSAPPTLLKRFGFVPVRVRRQMAEDLPAERRVATFQRWFVFGVFFDRLDDAGPSRQRACGVPVGDRRPFAAISREIANFGIARAAAPLFRADLLNLRAGGVLGFIAMRTIIRPPRGWGITLSDRVNRR
jgi:hypothetical protein